MPTNANTDVKVTPKNIASANKADVESKQHSDGSGDSDPLFKEFSWYASGASTGSSGLIHEAHDMAAGIAAILEMIEISGIADDCADRPVLSPFHRGQLMRMAITSSRLLTNACHNYIQAANDRYLEKADQAGAGQ